MNNSNNALAEIQSKYPNCNLLVPAATSVQINPFYKCTVMEVVADTSERSGDIFSVGKTKTGEDKNGNAIYEEVFSLAKPLLMKLATAAGIQFHPKYTTVEKENQNTYVGRAYGALRLPDGSYKTHSETKQICLDDEEAKYRLEFMDKSILGITDWKAAKAAEEMFKGHWEETGDTRTYNGREYPVKKYVIDDSDRAKYIERSLLVNMTLLRKTASEKAQTGAILRLVRAMLGIKGTYSKEELSRPFVVPTVTFAPDFTDPAVRNAMLLQGMNSLGNMFGTAPTPPAALPFMNETFNDSFDLEQNLHNPAFAPDAPADTEDYAEDFQQTVSEQEMQQQTPPEQEMQQQTPPEQEMQQQTPQAQETPPTQEGSAGYICKNCNAKINENVYSYSVKKFGAPLCMKCQKGARS